MLEIVHRAEPRYPQDQIKPETAMTLNINLTPQLEELVRKKVSSGRYNSASEVIREALRLMEAQDQLQAVRLTTAARRSPGW